MEVQTHTSPVFVIFGITGDLARRKLLPALYHLFRGNHLPKGTRIVGVTRQQLSVREVLAPLDTYVAGHKRSSKLALAKLKESFELVQADLTSPADYKRLKRHLDRTEREAGSTYQRLYYLSVPPAVLDEMTSFMGAAGMQRAYRKGPKPALLIEKSFGYDLASAQELVRSTKRYFRESQIYRIDHYLAKEMAQNILDFRFMNPLFTSVWNNHYIEKVVITAYENIGIEGRVAFYEQTGALRDLIQSHLLQLLALTAMEKPRTMTAAHIRARRRDVLKSVRPLEPYEILERARRGQYSSYRKEVGDDRTNIETYARVELTIENKRWKGVPFILQTGKAVGEKRTDIAVHFKENILTLQLQPEEVIGLRLLTKRPGHGHQTDATAMDFDYRRSYPNVSSPEAYERVLLDAAHQDPLLFASSDEVLAAWQVIDPILDEWQKSDTGMVFYEPGSLPFSETP